MITDKKSQIFCESSSKLVSINLNSQSNHLKLNPTLPTKFFRTSGKLCSRFTEDSLNDDDDDDDDTDDVCCQFLHLSSITR